MCKERASKEGVGGKLVWGRGGDKHGSMRLEWHWVEGYAIGRVEDGKGIEGRWMTENGSGRKVGKGG